MKDLVIKIMILAVLLLTLSPVTALANPDYWEGDQWNTEDSDFFALDANSLFHWFWPGGFDLFWWLRK